MTYRPEIAQDLNPGNLCDETSGRLERAKPYRVHPAYILAMTADEVVSLTLWEA
jgi:hypothetical protein